MNINDYWNAVLRQDADTIRSYFMPEAWINWHNTNEHFTVEEFIRANCEYPGSWDGEIEKTFFIQDQFITAVHVYSREMALHCHVVSFIHIEDNKIISIDEYWGDDGDVPKWRKDMALGCTIR